MGVKLRRQKILEYKVRGPVATCGAEFWRKIGNRSMVDPSKDLQVFVSSELLQLSTIHEQYRPVLGDAWKEIQAATSGITSVCLRKRRRSGFIKHVAAEQTDIEVISFSGEEKQSTLDSAASSDHEARGTTMETQLAQPCPIKWRSIAFEEGVMEPSHQQPLNIETLLESLGASKGNPLPPVFKQAGAKVMGYPQFVLEMKAALQAGRSQPHTAL